jgi:hypothetical protein
MSETTAPARPKLIPTPVPAANEACPIKTKLVDEIVARLEAQDAAAKVKRD